jgi:hypothetical protein
MSGTTALALYAALIGTAGLGWQVFTWARAHRTQVSVEAKNAVFGLPQGTVGGITVEAINRSSHTVRVTGIGFNMNDGTNRVVQIVYPGAGSSLPGSIAPHDSGMGWMSEVDVRDAGIDIYKPLVAWVRTSAGEQFNSKPVTLRVM